MTSVRATVVLGIATLLLAGCGASGPDRIGATDLDRQRDGVDDVARLVVSTLVADLHATGPSDTSLGRGLYAGCDGGDPDEASYFVDTFVTYDVMAPETAATRVAAALTDAGLTTKVDPRTYAISASDKGTTIDVTTQEKGGGSAGQNIFVSTGCLAIGKSAIQAFNARNGRAVTP